MLGDMSKTNPRRDMGATLRELARDVAEMAAELGEDAESAALCLVGMASGLVTMDEARAALAAVAA